MIYVFDSNSLINLFRHYYPERFPTLWERFNLLITKRQIISVKEVLNEIGSTNDYLSRWAKENKKLLFPEPTLKEFEFVNKIFQIKHFQAVIRKREMLAGKPVADPFITAKAKVCGGCVVTEEKNTPNAARIPNLCKYFEIDFTNLRGLMERENWVF